MTLNEKLKRLRQSKDNILIIHYSCQSLNDTNEGYSARITGIAVTQYEASITHSFSLHLAAERHGIKKEELEKHYDLLEKEILIEFWDFARERLQHYWIHWNMGSSTYGFQALAHRYKVLTGNDAPQIDDGKKFNLNGLIAEKYGERCLDDPKMKNLISLNGGIHRDFLEGKDESEAFKTKEFVRLHKSTITKTYFYSSILEKLLRGDRIHTNHNNWRAKFEIIWEHPATKVLSLLSIAFTLITGIWFFVDKIKTEPNKALEPMPMSVTDAAAQPPRQP